MLNKLSITLQSLKYGITERTNEKLFLFVLLESTFIFTRIEISFAMFAFGFQLVNIIYMFANLHKSLFSHHYSSKKINGK